MPSTPLGVAMTSTSKPCFLKIPASRASHGTAIDPDSDVIATRSLRNGGDSAALEVRAANDRKTRDPIRNNNRLATRFIVYSWLHSTIAHRLNTLGRVHYFNPALQRF
jgi:hypothetical protein